MDTPTALGFNELQKEERRQFVELLRNDLGCGESESLRDAIRRIKGALEKIAVTPMKDDGLALIQIARDALRPRVN